MAIPVKCPDCAFRFHVEAEYAGMPGRCPECDAVIDVPQLPKARRRFEDEGDDDDFDAPAVGSFASSSRRDVESYSSRDEQLEDEQPRFDPSVRIERWKSVSGGFRNLAIAAGLLGFDTLIRVTFNLVNGLPNDNANQMTSGQKAIMVGNCIFTALAMVLWAIGRINLAKTPYLPSAGLAKTSGVLAAINSIPGVIGILCAVIGIVIAADNLIAGMLLLQGGGCGLLIFGLGAIVTEIIGLLAQIKMTAGIKATKAATLAKVHLATFIVGVCLSIIGFCGMVIVIGSMAQEQVKKAQNKQAQANPPGPVKGNPVPPVNPGANPQNQPPPFNLEENKGLVIGMMITFATLSLGYVLLSVLSFLSAQGAVRKEIERLTRMSEGNSDEDYDRFAMGD